MNTRMRIWRALSCALTSSSNRRTIRRPASIDKLEDRLLLTAGNGLQGMYFNTPDLTGPALQMQVDTSVDFDWGAGSPHASLGNDNFSVRWSGRVEPQFTETYSFIVNANDGARLWINGQLLIDQFESGSVADATATINLIAGRRYDIQMEYLEVSGNASVSLEWSSSSLTREIIPAQRLHASDRGTIQVQQFDGIGGSAVADLTSNASFPDSPTDVSSITSFESISNTGEDFGQRIVGQIHAPISGPYTFYIAANESAELWLSNTSDPAQKQLIAAVNSATAPRDWLASTSQKSTAIYLAAGQDYFVEALHKESTGADHLAVAWTRPGSATVDIIDGKHLSPLVPTVRIYSSRPNVAEGSAVPAVFTVVRSGSPSNLPLDVNYSIGGDASNGTDYQSLSGMVTIPAGANSVDLTLTPIADSLFEGNESVVIELLAGPGYEVGLQSERTANGNVQDNVDAPSGGLSLWNGQQLSDFSHFGATFTTESDPTYGNVIQAEIIGTPASTFSVQLRQNINTAVVEGDILWVEFRVKSIGGDGNIAAIFERAGAPYTKSLIQGIPATTDWARVQIPFYAAESYAAGEASFGFHLGYQAQTLQFADFEVLNYGPPRTLTPESAFGLNNISGVHSTSQIVPVSGQPFTFAYEVDVYEVPDQVWHVQAVARNGGVISNGDSLHFQFSVRSTAGTVPQTSFVVQRTDTYATLYSQMIDLTSDWQSFTVEFDANDEFGVNGLQAVFNLGYEVQTAQIGGFHWQNLENAVNFSDLPKQFPASTYDGRDGTDTWRESADERIANDRKSNVTVNVTDNSGQPLEGAVVSLRQTKHEFLFGSAISAYGGKLDPNGNAQSLKYQSEIKRLFNTVVLENSLKWPSYLQDPARAQAGVDFGVNNDLFIRGHNVIWPSRTFMPASIWSEYDTREANDGTAAANDWLKLTIENHINTIVTTFESSITEWDVVNEPWSNHDVMDLLGDSIIVDWHQQIRDINPNIKLTLNDYGIFAGNGANTEHRASFEYWLGLLNDANLLDVIGEQSHYSDASLTDIVVLGQLITTYNSQFNKPIAITEFDVDSADEQLQADYLRDYMTMSFSQPAVTEFLHWGFWQNSHWLPDAALYRSDFSIKPNGQAYEDLVFGQWWSDIQGTTRGGIVSADVFRGDYDVIVEYGGQTYTGNVTVDSSGNSNVLINVTQDPTNYDPIINTDNPIVNGNVAQELSNSGGWFEPDHEAVTITASLGQITTNANGTWNWTFTPTQAYANQFITITVTDARGASGNTSFTINADTNIVTRGVSYGDSSFGDNALAPKSALRPGFDATVDNFTNYHLGLNRVVIDVAGLTSTTLADSDFEFRVGNSDTPSNWLLVDGTGSIPLPSHGVSSTATPGVSRIMLAWPNNAIQNQWLQVTLKSTSNTGLAVNDVFYFGNQIGDVNGDVNASNQIRVNSLDTILVRGNRTIGGTVGIENLYDIDRNGTVNSLDTIRVRGNRVISGGLLMISVPAASPDGFLHRSLGNFTTNGFDPFSDVTFAPGFAPEFVSSGSPMAVSEFAKSERQFEPVLAFDTNKRLPGSIAEPDLATVLAPADTPSIAGERSGEDTGLRDEFFDSEQVWLGGELVEPFDQSL